MTFVVAITHRTAPILLTSLVLTACGSRPARRGPIDPALGAFVSPDTVALAGVRMDRLRATPIYRKLAEENRLPRLGQFLSGDTHDILFASDGSHALAIARGAFPAKPSGGLTSAEYKGFTLYGSIASVRAAIKQYESGRPAVLRDLMARAAGLPADAQIWAVAAGWRGATPDQLREMGNLSNLDRVMRLVEGASLTVDLRTGAHAAFTGDCRTDADAKQLGDSLRGLAALVRMAVQGKQPDLLRAVD
jgi:hypothetical protein